MGDGDEYSDVRADVEPNGLVGVQATFVGSGGADLARNPWITVRERRWFNRYRDTVREVTRERRQPTGNRRPGGREGEACWDEEEVRTFVDRGTATVKLGWYEDWELSAHLDEYLRWMRSAAGSRRTITIGADARLPADGVLPIPEITATDVDDRDFVKQERMVGSGWEVRDTKSQNLTQATEGVSEWVAGPRYPCPGTTGQSTQAAAHVQVLDVDTGLPVRGTVAISGAALRAQTPAAAGGPDIPDHPRPLDAPIPINEGGGRDGAYLISELGKEVTVVHRPPPGYEVVRNSENQVTPSTIRFVARDPDRFMELVFYDRRAKPAEPSTAPPPAAPVPPPAAPAPGDGGRPGGAVPPETPRPARPGDGATVPIERIGVPRGGCLGVPFGGLLAVVLVIALLGGAGFGIYELTHRGGGGSSVTTGSSSSSPGSSATSSAPAALVSGPYAGSVAVAPGGDPAGHSCCVKPSTRWDVLQTRDRATGAITIRLAAVVDGIEVTGPLASTGAPFTATGSGTVVGRPGTEVSFAGSVAPGRGLHGMLTVGGNGTLPTGQAITFSVDMTRAT